MIPMIAHRVPLALEKVPVRLHSSKDARTRPLNTLSGLPRPP